MANVERGMLDDESIARQLWENNPFASSASPLPWDNPNPDVGQLNRKAAEDIEQLLRNKRRAPSTPLAGLVLGEAGSGKTHMLTRLLRKVEGGQIAIFVTVRTFRDPERVMGHLLAETVVSLGSRHSEGRCQLDVLMDEFDSAYEEQCRERGLSVRKGVDRLNALRGQMPGIEKGLLRCLLLHAEASDPNVKMMLRDWIWAGLDEEDASQLGLPPRDIDVMTSAAREADAERMLLSLGQVLAYAKVPMMVCFDQLDGMDSKELINAWGRALSLLVNDLSGVLPLAFLRADTWNERFSVMLDDSVVQRLTPHKIVMENCTPEQAEQLIRGRIEGFFDEGAERIYQWCMTRLGGKIRGRYSPRMVIELAAHAIDEAQKGTSPVPESSERRREEPLNAIGAAYHEECDKVRANPNAYPPDAERLLLALKAWLDAQKEFDVESIQDKYIRLRGQGRSSGRTVECAFIVLTPAAYGAAGAGLRRGIKFLQQHQGALCCYITDGRTHKGPQNWRVVGQLLEEFCGLGGEVRILDEEARAKWYGLAALIDKLDNGDVTLWSGSDMRRAVRGDLERYMKEGFSEDLLGLGSKTSGNTEGKASAGTSAKEAPNDEAVADLLDSFLNRSPMKLLTMSKLLVMFKDAGVSVTHTGLLACASRFKDRFRFYPSGNDAIIQRAGR